MSRIFKIVLALLIVASLASAAAAVIGFMGKEREYMKRLVVEDKLALTLKEKRVIEKEVETLKSAKEQSESKVAKLEEKLKDVSAQLTEIKQKEEAAASELELKSAELAKIKVDMDNEKKEKLAISKKLESIQSDFEKAKKEASRLINEKMSIEKKITELQEKQAVNLDKIVVNTPEQDVPVSAFDAPPAVKPIMQGKVLVVNKEYSFIVSDIGQDKNVQKGMKFDIVDGARTLGQAEIDKVYDTMSSATVLPGSRINEMKKGNTIIESR